MNANLWFFGTGHFAARCLEEISTKYPPSFVVTSPPTAAGRGMKMRISPVEVVAQELKLPLRHSASVNKDEKLQEILAVEKPDLIFVIDFGQKIGEPYLSEPTCGCLNIHPSLLPRYRGAAPVQRAIMDGAKTTGVTLFRLVEKMDAGPIWLQKEYEIQPKMTAWELLFDLAREGSQLFIKNAEGILDGTIVPKKQDEKLASIAPKIEKSEAKLSPLVSAEKLSFIIRGLNPSPGAYIVHRGRRVKILQSIAENAESAKFDPGCFFLIDQKPFFKTAKNSLRLITVQPEGKKEMSAEDWARGVHLRDGEKIDS